VRINFSSLFHFVFLSDITFHDSYVNCTMVDLHCRGNRKHDTAILHYTVYLSYSIVMHGNYSALRMSFIHSFLCDMINRRACVISRKRDYSSNVHDNTRRSDVTLYNSERNRNISDQSGRNDLISDN